MTPRNSKAGAGLGRKLAVALLAPVLLFGLAEAGLWIAGVRPVLFERDPYVGFSAQVPLFVEQTNAAGERVWRTATNKLGFFNDQQFAFEKPAGTRRIFCVGGSTTYGRPYADSTSFNGWLRAFLEQADADGEWEVINAGGISYASYRVAMLMEELIQYDPDLFIVYSGQNEFLEQRTYSEILAQSSARRWLGSFLNRTRIGTVLRNAVDGGYTASDAARKEGRSLLSGEVKTRLDDVVGPEDYERDDGQAARILEHYRHNLERMVDIAQAGGAKVLFVTPASNLRDCEPFKSVVADGLSAEQSARLESELAELRALQAASRWMESLDLADAALAVDARHAHFHFLRGRALDRLGRSEEAAIAYQRAADEDVCPLRSLSAMQPVVREVSTERGTALLDFDALTRAWTAPAVPGEDLFLDHVHPTVDAHRRLALALVDRLLAEGYLRPHPNWNEEARQRIRQEVEATLDSETQAEALLNLSKVVGWAGKHAEARRYAERALALAPTNATILYNLAIAQWNTGDEEVAMESYRRVLQAVPNHVESLNNLGLALYRRGQAAEAMNLYRRALASDPEHVRALINLGNALAKSGKSLEAIPLYESALALEPDLAQIQNNLGNALCAVGRVEEGIERYRKALALNPEHTSAHHNLGNVLLHYGQREEALVHYRAALAADPDFEAAQISLEKALATDGEG